MEKPPRPTALVWAGASMLAGPAAVVLFLCFKTIGAIAIGEDRFCMPAEHALATVALAAVMAALVLAVEHSAIVKRNAKAAAWIAGCCIFFPAFLGWISWVEAVLRLVGVLARDDRWRSLVDVSLEMAFLSYLAIVAWGHVIWIRLLRHAKKIEPVDSDA